MKYVPETGCELYEVQAPPMLIDPFLPAACLGGLSGGPGVGKTWFALEACRAIATGTPFLGRFPVQTRVPTLLIGSDSSKFDYGRCWRRLTERQYEELGGQQLGDDPTNENNPDAHIGDLNPLNDLFRHIIGSDFSLDDEAAVAAMMEAVDYEWGPYEWQDDEPGDIDQAGYVSVIPGGWRRQRGSGLIIMDTFGSLTEEDLIDNSAMIRVYQKLRRFVTVTGATVLLLNHNPKGAATWLGAISQVGKLDFWLHLRQPKKTTDPDYIQIEFKKTRGIRPSNAISYRMNVNDPTKPDVASLISEKPEGEQAKTPARAPVVIEADADRALILELLRTGKKRMSDFVAAKQASPNRAQDGDVARRRLARKLDQMVETGDVDVEKASGKASIWFLQPKAA
jgi:hypothetical protein